MKFDVGDTVLLLHSKGEGVIVELLGSDVVSVKVSGVVFPVFTDQIDFPYFDRFTKKRGEERRARLTPGEELPVEKPSGAPREEQGVYLSFLPQYDGAAEDALVQSLKIHLLNETSGHYHFHYRLVLSGKLELEVKNDLAPFRHFYLQDLAFEALNDRPRFEFVFSPDQPQKDQAEQFPVLFKPKARQVMQQLHQLRAQGGATFSHLLFTSYPVKTGGAHDWDLPEPGSGPLFIKIPGPTPLPPPVYEVDLHLEKLLDHSEGLSAADMLAIQLAALHKQLELAIVHRQPSLVVIHGVGKGTLRNEVHEVLRHVPEVRSFVNQYDFRYGYGATEIFFEYK